MISSTIFLTHNNTFSIEFLRDDAVIDFVATGVTRIVGVCPSLTIDSEIDVAAFDYITYGTLGIIEFHLADLDLGIGKHKFDAIVFDTLHPAGEVWEDAFTVTVKAATITNIPCTECLNFSLEGSSGYLSII
jgi:hypothetical protein